MLHDPTVFLTLHGSKDYAATFKKEAFKILNDWKRDNAHTEPPELVKLEEELGGGEARVIIKMHNGLTNMHIIAEREVVGAALEEEREPEKIILEKRKTKVITRVIVHVDIYTFNTSTTENFIYSDRSSVSSAVVAATWDSGAFVDISEAECPYLVFGNEDFAAQHHANTADWPGIYPDITGYDPVTLAADVDGPHLDAAVAWYDSFLPTVYGPGTVIPQESTAPFYAQEESWIEYPAGTERYTYFTANDYFLYPFYADNWLIPPSGSFYQLPHDQYNACDSTYVYSDYLLTGGTNRKYNFFDATRKHYDLSAVDAVSKQCGFSYSYLESDSGPKNYEVMAHSSPVFGPVFNLTTWINGYGTQDFQARGVTGFDSGSFILFGYGSIFPSGVIKGNYPPLTKLIYPVAQIRNYASATEFHQALSRPFGGTGSNPVSGTLQNGDSWICETMSCNVREKDGAGYKVNGMVNLNMAIGPGISVFGVADTPHHTLATAGLVDLFERAVRRAGGYTMDPMDLTDYLIDTRSPSDVFGGTSFDVRESSNTVACSPLQNFKVYVAPIRVTVEEEQEEFNYGA